MRFSRVRAIRNAGLFIALVAGLLPAYLLLSVITPRHRRPIAALFFKGCLKLTGIRLAIAGWPAPNAALFVANHVSYLDVAVLGAVLGDVVFIAKKEVADWPLFGFLARIAATEFVARSGAGVQGQCNALAKRLDSGSALILFPEGTSTDGTHVRTFKSPLFAALNMTNTTGRVQPITLVYERTACAWYGDMTLAPHLWRMFGTCGGRVHIVLHDPVCLADFPDRKQMAKYCENVVRDALDEALFEPSTPLPAAAE